MVSSRGRELVSGAIVEAEVDDESVEAGNERVTAECWR